MKYSWIKTFRAFDSSWTFECPSKASFDRARSSLGYYRAMWEGELCAPLNKKDVVVDVGGHIGFFSIPISSQVKKVITYEPAPANYAMLLRNIDRNHIHNIEPIQASVGDRDGMVEFYLGRSTMGHSVLYKGNRKSMGRVPMKSFSAISKKFHPSVVKLDCEGGEWLILTKAHISFLQDVRLLIAELHKVHQQDMVELTRVLRKAGFKTHIDGSNRIHLKRLIAYK